MLTFLPALFRGGEGFSEFCNDVAFMLIGSMGDGVQGAPVLAADAAFKLPHFVLHLVVGILKLSLLSPLVLSPLGFVSAISSSEVTSFFLSFCFCFTAVNTLHEYDKPQKLPPHQHVYHLVFKAQHQLLQNELIIIDITAMSM